MDSNKNTHACHSRAGGNDGKWHFQYCSDDIPTTPPCRLKP
ncbi:hypothetical protein ACTHT7_12710 [Neisseria sp. P0017.S010]